MKGSDVRLINVMVEQMESKLRRVSYLFRHIALTPFEITTPEGRAKERLRRVMLAAIGMVAAKGISAITILVSVPLTVNYLGAERYGMWMTISSLITILSFADLGIGNGLVNLLAESHGRDDQESAIRYVSSAFFMLVGIGLLIVVLYFIASTWISWERIFNVKSDLAIKELRPALAVFTICFALNIPLGLIEKVQTAYQEGFHNSLWQGSGNIIALVGLLLAINLDAGLPWLVLSMAGVPIVTTAINGWVQFHYRRPWLRPIWQAFDWTTSLRLTSIGGVFLLLQVMAILGSSSDNLIIARLYGVTAVTHYAVVQKLFSLALIPHYIVAPLWPAFGEALARQDYDWAKKTLFRTILISCLFELMIAIPLLICGPKIISFWLDISLVPNVVLLLGFSIEAVVGAYKTTISVFLNSSYMLKAQSLLFGTASLGAIALKFLLGFYYSLPGIIWGGVIAFSILYVVPAWVLTRRVLIQVKPDVC
jgi:O-antigen/teichoic acid export membrane protein